MNHVCGKHDLLISLEVTITISSDCSSSHSTMTEVQSARKRNDSGHIEERKTDEMIMDESMLTCQVIVNDKKLSQITSRDQPFAINFLFVLINFNE